MKYQYFLMSFFLIGYTPLFYAAAGPSEDPVKKIYTQVNTQLTAIKKQIEPLIKPNVTVDQAYTNKMIEVANGLCKQVPSNLIDAIGKLIQDYKESLAQGKKTLTDTKKTLEDLKQIEAQKARKKNSRVEAIKKSITPFCRSIQQILIDMATAINMQKGVVNGFSVYGYKNTSKAGKMDLNAFNKSKSLYTAYVTLLEDVLTGLNTPPNKSLTDIIQRIGFQKDILIKVIPVTGQPLDRTQRNAASIYGVGDSFDEIIGAV